LDLSVNVAKAKREMKLPIFDKKREREILDWVTESSGDYDSYSRLFFLTLFDLSKTLQNQILAEDGELTHEVRAAILPSSETFPKNVSVAVQGTEGAYSQQAADKLFSMGKLNYYTTFRDVFDAVDKGQCEFGILPIENSVHGSVNEVYQLMNEYSFYIVRSVKQFINHELLAKAETSMEDIKEIFSHSQAIGQCSNFLDSLENVKVTPFKNTALAAKEVAENSDIGIAAISSHSCKELYNLKSINANIQNSNNNYTRFIVISKDMKIYPGSNKITLVLSTPHRPGGLYAVMAQFAALGLNLTKLESHPIPGKDFNFQFYFDIEASVTEEETLRLLENLKLECDNFHFLGNYMEQ
ncbi:MAG: prephenate dehydratase domain-containing protein, partial [Gallicola sp.]|nr:prephenate dehydratase domain-containing protein [Gallicola sp.]